MGKKDWKNTLSGVFDVIGEVLAVVYVVVFALLLIDAQWPFLSNVDWLYAVFKGIWTYGAFVIAAIVGLEAMVKRNFLLFLIFAALLVVCVIFIFFPGTYESLFNFLPSNSKYGNFHNKSGISLDMPLFCAGAVICPRGSTKAPNLRGAASRGGRRCSLR